MTARRRFALLFLLLVASLLLFFIVAWLPDAQTQQAKDSLQEPVIQEMSGLPFVPQDTCSLRRGGEEVQDFYTQTRARTLAQVLAAPQARGFSASDLLDLFSKGVESATDTADCAFLIDEHNGLLLVSMKLPVCARRHKYYFMPELYVFSRTGDYWSLVPGVIRDIEWLRDRWVGMMQLQIEEGRELYAFVHVVQEAGAWRLRTFNDVPNGPGLMYLPGPDMVAYANGYQRISYSSDQAYGPLPCAFGGALSALKSRDSCHDCLIQAAHAVYHGAFTFAWTGDQYILTDETPYQITIILSDNTRLEEIAPTEADLAQKSPFLRPGSWRNYCQAVSPAQANLGIIQEKPK
jgi:hypothetical protein